ncbi:flagellar biosynthetic protein FliR [Silvimonas terrae]|uniref:Flagellar biosynthetic protein FliR n=1 Tax=Silvimonas terrae TaxID=300266 RepID=A0A840RKX1_9NEIS|nr:flagellar biosynthetic protein FliR [Silvimonas terrae]MBB5192946.1 flagellar biosynthetic protein FliR [Silvimonas terrae]
MFTITDAQINGWLALFLWPFLRIFGVLMADPFFSNAAINTTVRVGLALLLTLLIAPVLPAMPNVPVLSAQGIMIGINQLLIGWMIGMCMQLIFSTVEMGGNIAGLQMGLGFASFYDPQSAGNVPLVAQFLSAATLLLFLAMNGHLIVLRALIESFAQLPPTDAPLASGAFRMIAEHGSMVFSTGLQLAMPVVGALLVTNLAVGVMTRAAPQLNVFAIGFPIMLSIGAAALYMLLPYLPQFVGGMINEFTRFVNSLMQTLAPQ